MGDSSGLFNGIPISESAYGYLPSRTVSIIVLALFAISTLTHAVQAIRYRMWFLLGTAVFCGAIEILGWSGRLWSSFDPFLDIPFQIQITCTIVAPTPLLAATFVIFGRMIRRLGPAYSRLSPKWYTILFFTSDFVSLVVQGVGGGVAATADTHDGAEMGGNIMLGGIVFQLVVIVAFSICFVEFFVRYTHHAPISSSVQLRDGQPAYSNDMIRGRFTGRLKIMTFALIFSTTVLFIRAIYRTIELADGWNGRIISTEIYFNVLDGAMVILAIYTLNFAHPGIMLDAPEEQVKYVAA